jgi:hypothetical protein
VADPMRIWAWQADEGGCGFYRIAEPMNALKRAGHHVNVAVQREGFIEYKHLGNCGGPAEIALVQRIVLPDMAPAIRRLRTPPRKVIYEIDDDMFSIDPANWDAFRLYNSPNIRDTLKLCANQSHLVTVSTEPLAEVMRRECDVPVAVLPNCVPDGMFAVDRIRLDRCRVGWAGGMGHEGDMRSILTPLRRFLDRTPDVDLHLIGYDFRRLIARPRVYWSSWVRPMPAYWSAIDFDIGIAPLSPTIFNRSKCINSDMRVTTASGVCRAGDLQAGMRVWRDGWRRIQAVERGPARPGLLITLRDGYQLRLTPEHRMLRGDQWVCADAFAVGDRLVMEAESVGPTEYVRAPWPADSRMSRAGAGNSDPFDPGAFLNAEDGPKVEITPRWGRLLGAYAGDGSVGQATKVTISCDGQDQDWIDQVMADFRACGLNPRTEMITTFDGKVLRRRGVTVASAHLLRVLESWGLTRPRESGKPIRVVRVPEVIWRSPREVIAEFLAGYFEADGHCTGNGAEVTSKDEQMIRDVQRLLLLFGITSRVSRINTAAQNGYVGEAWRCTLRRAEVDVFAKEIGFRSIRKSTRLAEITARPHSNRYTPMEWSREIVAIEPCTVDPIDIQVEGSTFVLAGFVSHNSGLKALEYGALGIPIVAADAAPYRDVVVHGKTGFLVSRDDQWVKYLRELVYDAELREQMGAAAKQHVAGYALSRNWRRWEAAFGQVLGRDVTQPEPELVTA